MRQIVRLAFRHEGSDHQVMTAYEVAKVLRMPAGTVYNVVKRYRARGLQVVSHRGHCGRSISHNNLLTAFVGDPDRVQRWAMLTLRERCQLITE